jgi:hypothetical protein
MAENLTLATFAKNVADGSDAARLALAQQLKEAGLWKGKVSSKFNINYYNALVELEKKYTEQVKLDTLLGITTAATRYDILASLREEGAGDGGTAGPRTTRQTYVTSPTQTAKLLDTVAQDLLGRNLTKAEKAKYTKLINAEQKRQPSVNVSGAGFSTTTGNVDEEQFVTEKLQATGEAKTYRATDAYTVMMQELGGLR